ncbi:MAG: hypothetical protein JWM86_2058 [Thermoleophilia bacterium]|nr:hypothetical protein [Thermoleophilia bacterium]
MDKRLDFGAAFSRVFDLYGKYFVPLITYSAIFYGVLALFWTLVVGVLITSLAAGIGFAALGLVLTIIASMLLSGAYILALDDAEKTGSFPSFGEVWPRVTPKLGALVVTSLLAGIGIAVGFVLLIVPGLVLATWWFVAAAVVMLEGESGPGALGRSRALVRGNGWTVFGLVVVVNLITGIASSILGKIIEGIFGFNDLVATFFGQFIPGVLTAPIGALLTVVVYQSLTGAGGSGGSEFEQGTMPPATYPAVPPTTPPPASTDHNAGPFV